ncbi:MAG: beta-galactosidase [Clostridia bacterium]|nr:beta-galactosidase [Clostridia bacterium]
MLPRPEYPRPQMVRDRWMNLNGEWEFEMDHGKSGRPRKRYEANGLDGKILVPFCPESKLSGIGHTDFMACVWYSRAFEVPDGWRSERVLLHFGAVDYKAEVWINGVSTGTHKGGYSSFYFDITEHLAPGTNRVTLCAEDDVRSGLQPRGKQSDKYHSYSCLYTRTTGIWQTVWLECVPQTYIGSLKYIPDPDNGCIHIEASFKGGADGCAFVASAAFGTKKMGDGNAVVTGDRANITIHLSEKHLWEPGAPNLYDLQLSLEKGGRRLDTVSSYFGLRSVKLKDRKIWINDKPVFQRLVLDQGFYPDGIYTAPTDEALKKDIEIAIGLGFNGARMHEKMFEPRYIYWADKLGFLLWGEHANWGLDITTAAGLANFLPEWMETLERDFNSPAIIGWCPFNETWDMPCKSGHGNIAQDDEVLRIVYLVTKALDKTRPVIDTSGNYHVVTDVFDIHPYEQDVAKFSAFFEPMKHGGEAFNTFPDRQTYQNQPYFVSEYGGIWWNPGQMDDKSWGYGARPATEEEFFQRYEGLTHTLLDNPHICAFCYTQLYDVEQEVNGLYTYDRKPKFDPEMIRKINTRKAAIE